MLLINFENNLILAWSVNYVISYASEAKTIILAEANLHIQIVEYIPFKFVDSRSK